MISQYFSDAEAVITQHRNIDNTPPTEVWPVIFNTAQRMDVVRRVLGNPVIVSSWYRSAALNAAVGSRAKMSQHMKGEAVDFICPGAGSPTDVAAALLRDVELLQFDQLILEHTWVHISFVSNTNGKPRKQALTLLKSGAYATGLTTPEGKPLCGI